MAIKIKQTIYVVSVPSGAYKEEWQVVRAFRFKEDAQKYAEEYDGYIDTVILE